MTFAGSSVTMRKRSIATTFDGLPRLRATTSSICIHICVHTRIRISIRICIKFNILSIYYVVVKYINA